MIWILVLALFQYAAGQTLQSPMYPYGSSVGDQKLPDSVNLPVYMGYKVNFYGRQYSMAYITKNGFVGFDPHSRYEHFIFKDGARDHTKDYPFIAPFYFDGEAITKYYQGNIYYRLVFRNTSQPFLNDIQYYILNSTVGVEHFVPDVALVVTWENVTDKSKIDSGECLGTLEKPCKSATFQLVLAACPMNTFVIINYQKMEIANLKYYQSGINGGHAVGWTPICSRPNCQLNDLPTETGSDVRGRFIFRVSGDTIERGGCNNGNDMQIAPGVVGMFGGEMLNISGPCLRSSDVITCKFGIGQDSPTSQGVRVNDMILRCPVPKLKQRGSVTLSVSLNGGQTYTAQGSIYIVMESKVPKSLELTGGWHKTKPTTLQMTWDTNALSSDPNAKVDIRLVGYREDSVATYWKPLKTITTGQENTGSYSFSAGDVQCVVPSECDMYEVGVVEVELQQQYRPTANSRIRMVGGVLLGWYVHNHMARQYGGSWPSSKCTQWYNKDGENDQWLNKLLHCPCTVDQALSDFGRWQPDHGCSMFSKSATNCYYHVGAKHCVRSFQPTSDGAGNQCCYSENGLLIYAADSYNGSTPDRSHDWGASPYISPRHVPSMSHWIDDVVSFYYCCLWVDGYCDYYMQRRPTRDCIGYQPSKAAVAYGDPHINTFDGQLYNFGGKGDYYLVKTPDSQEFKLQGKFDFAPQNRNENGTKMNATVLNAVVMKGMSDTKVEIRLAPIGLYSGRRLEVYVDNQLKMFDQPTLYKQDFDGVSVINVVGDDTNNLQENFTVIFKSGIGVQVAASNTLLHVIVNMPPAFGNKTSGLLGTWSGRVDDDYTASGGNVVPITDSAQNVFLNFAKSWAVAEVNSLFAHKDQPDDVYVPLFTQPNIPPGSAYSLTDIRYTCQDSAQCRYDYIVTGSRDIAQASRKAAIWFSELKSFQRPVVSCGLLNAPYAKKDNNNYTVGNTVTVTGCRNGGDLSGDLTYTCVSTSPTSALWDPSVTAACSDAPESADVGLIVGVVIAVLVVVIIIIVIVVMYMRKKGSRKDSKKGEPEMEAGQKSSMIGELKRRHSRDDETSETRTRESKT